MLTTRCKETMAEILDRQVERSPMPAVKSSQPMTVREAQWVKVMNQQGPRKNNSTVDLVVALNR